MSVEQDEILTSAEAAQALKVSAEQLSSLLEAHEIPGRKLDGEWRTTRRALTHYVDGMGMSCCEPGTKGCC